MDNLDIQHWIAIAAFALVLIAALRYSNEPNVQKKIKMRKPFHITMGVLAPFVMLGSPFEIELKVVLIVFSPFVLLLNYLVTRNCTNCGGEFKPKNNEDTVTICKYCR